jgi:DNA-binding beta-propeller fold protein YncE
MRRAPKHPGRSRSAGPFVPLATAVLLMMSATPPAEACPPPLEQWAVEAQPFFLAVAPSGRVYATNALTHQVSVHGPDGTLLRQWGGLGAAHGQLSSPTGVAVDANGRVYVSDGGNSRIEVFDADGGYLTTIQNVGTGPGQFAVPVDLAIGPANDLFVVNQMPGHNKIVRMTLAGAFLDEWPVTIVNTEYDIAVDADGSVYGLQVATSTSVDVFTSAGVSLGSWPVAVGGETVQAGHLDVHVSLGR